jgi:hypothetical protein
MTYVVPEAQRGRMRTNAGAAAAWPQIPAGKPAADEADQWADVKDRRSLPELA